MSCGSKVLCCEVFGMKFKVTYRTPDGGLGEKMVQGRSRRDAVLSFAMMFPFHRIVGVERVEEEILT